MNRAAMTGENIRAYREQGGNEGDLVHKMVLHTVFVHPLRFLRHTNRPQTEFAVL